MPPSNHASSSKIPSSSHATVSHPKSSGPTRLRNDAEPGGLPDDLLARKERAIKVYNQLKSVGMPEEIGLDAFLALYLGEGRKGVSSEGKDSKKEKGDDKASRPKRGTQTRDARKEGNLTSEQAPVSGAADALERLSERLVGRTQVAKVRQGITARQDRGEIENVVAREEGKRDSLSRVLTSLKTEWEVESRKVKDLEEKKSTLEIQEADLRRKIMLLGVLEGLESVRMKRLGCIEGVGTRQGERRGMGDLINELRKEVAFASGEVYVVLSNSQKKTLHTSSQSSILTKGHHTEIHSRRELAFQHSTVALANLHAYHTHLKRVQAAQPEADPTALHQSGEDLERRLETALRGVGAQSGLGTELQELQKNLMVLAKRRAVKERYPLMSARVANMSVEDLKEKQRVNETKRKEVQRLLDRVVALGWVCEGYVDLISTFRQETAPTLEMVLGEEQKRVEGRIDLMKAEVLKVQPPPEPGFAQQVRDIMGTTKLRVWKDIEDAFKRSSKLKSIELKRLEVVLPVEIPDHSQLLRRKTTKAEHGYGLAEEVRRLLEGSKKLKYV